jgi:hypothetical protein
MKALSHIALSMLDALGHIMKLLETIMSEPE